ncbi:RING/U-box superfamily protein [Actinidia rufa]|uniref:RING/U-box superfamily protein n=1 Tax=Actinidia rufa TaxID=165716 RepID=A0A7J0G3Z7_9ERIC|nr:RING/U-box superfamily protein [Actinidia rufa]
MASTSAASRPSGVAGRIQSAATTLFSDNQSLIAEIRKVMITMKDVAVDLEGRNQSQMVKELEDGVLQLLVATEDCSHFSSAIQSVGNGYQPATELTDFKKLFDDEIAKSKANSSSVLQNHLLLRQFREAIWSSIRSPLPTSVLHLQHHHRSSSAFTQPSLIISSLYNLAPSMTHLPSAPVTIDSATNPVAAFPKSCDHSLPSNTIPKFSDHSLLECVSISGLRAAARASVLGGLKVERGDLGESWEPRESYITEGAKGSNLNWILKMEALPVVYAGNAPTLLDNLTNLDEPEKNVHHAGQPMPGEEQEDLVMTSTQSNLLNIICPLTGKPITELLTPVRSYINKGILPHPACSLGTVTGNIINEYLSFRYDIIWSSVDCKHIYEKDAIMPYIKFKNPHSQCPVAGCPKIVVAERVVCDPLLLVEIDEMRCKQSARTDVVEDFTNEEDSGRR